MHYWLVKTEPETYSWNTLVQNGTTSWTGVRNAQARNMLRAMDRGDYVFVYHSVTEKAILGIAEVVTSAYPDPTATHGTWVTIDLQAVRPLKRPLTLAEIKSIPRLQSMVLVKNSRLSVQPVSMNEWNILTAL